MVYLSIVIPVRNEEKFISETLQALINQDYPKDRFELIVVDGSSTDGTRSVVE
jgi:glycosyltransferase involved in cell wall biosynthesis